MSDDQAIAASTAAQVLETKRAPEVLRSALSLFRRAESISLDPIVAFAAGSEGKTRGCGFSTDP